MNKAVDVFLRIRNSKFFNTLVILIIIASAIYAGISSYNLPELYLNPLKIFDYVITIFFVFEIVIRIVSEKSFGRFFRDGWNVFDFIIVFLSLIPVGAGSTIFVARLLRIIRVLRIITVVPAFRKIIDSLIMSLPRVGFVALLLFIFTYIFAVIGTMLFSDADALKWGNVGRALLTLAQVATFDDWGAIMGIVLQTNPSAWIYVIFFIIINAVILLNMVIGVIVDLMISENSKTSIIERSINKYENQDKS